MSTIVELTTNSEAETARLAAEVSNYAAPGEFFGLTGDLGCGKSVFARAFLRALAGDDDLEVPSPTFTLVQSYDDLRLRAAHFDLYRIVESTEVDELGLQDALEEGIALVEWPDKITTDNFDDRLMIHIEDTSPTRRKLTLSGHGTWACKLGRWRLSVAFLQNSGWGEAKRKFLQGDASHRRYERIGDEDRHGILMDMPQQSDGPVLRDGKSYSALAHLAEGVEPFITVTAALQSIDLAVPEIFAHDIQNGFLLLEDLGPQVYFDMAAQNQDITVPMYAAIDVLVHLSASFNEAEKRAEPAAAIFPVYDGAALQIEIELLPDWYWSWLKGQEITPTERDEFLDLWHPLWQHLEGCPRIWTLRDYHSPNLIWLPEREGLARVGLLDYQDGVMGSPAYDLMSLLQDARRDVSPEVEQEMYAYYWQQIAATKVKYDRADFDFAYAVLGAQRATKILGIFARLAKRDHKPGYLVHMPRVRAYLERNLQHPALQNLKSWFDLHLSSKNQQQAAIK